MGSGSSREESGRSSDDLSLERRDGDPGGVLEIAFAIRYVARLGRVPGTNKRVPLVMYMDEGIQLTPKRVRDALKVCTVGLDGRLAASEFEEWLRGFGVKVVNPMIRVLPPCIETDNLWRVSYRAELDVSLPNVKELESHYEVLKERVSANYMGPLPTDDDGMNYDPLHLFHEKSKSRKDAGWCASIHCSDAQSLLGDVGREDVIIKWYPNDEPTGAPKRRTRINKKVAEHAAHPTDDVESDDDEEQATTESEDDVEEEEEQATTESEDDVEEEEEDDVVEEEEDEEDEDDMSEHDDRKKRRRRADSRETAWDDMDSE